MNDDRDRARSQPSGGRRRTGRVVALTAAILLFLAAAGILVPVFAYATGDIADDCVSSPMPLSAEYDEDGITPISLMKRGAIPSLEALGTAPLSLFTVQFTFNANQKLYAVQTTDGGLYFDRLFDAPVKGGTYDTGSGKKTVAEVYTGFEETAPASKADVKWNAARAQITSVTFKAQTASAGTAWWFADMTKLTSVNGLEYLDMSNAATMKSMFDGASALATLQLPASFKTSKVSDMSRAFANMSALTTFALPSASGAFDANKVSTFESMFEGTAKLASLDLGTMGLASPATNATMKNMFKGMTALKTFKAGVSFNTSRVTDASGMFEGDSALTSVDLGDVFGANAMTTVKGMFKGASSLVEFTFPHAFGVNTGKVTDFSNMFEGCTKLVRINQRGGSDAAFKTDAATTFTSMFKDCTALQAAGQGSAKSIQVTDFNVANATDLSYMFSGCQAIDKLDVSSWTTSKATTIEGMFQDCYALSELNTKKFVTTGITSMKYLFKGCRSLATLDLSSFDTTHLKGTDGMDQMFPLSLYTKLTRVVISDKFKYANVIFSPFQPLEGNNDGDLFPSPYNPKYSKLDGGTGTMDTWNTHENYSWYNEANGERFSPFDMDTKFSSGEVRTYVKDRPAGTELSAYLVWMNGSVSSTDGNLALVFARKSAETTTAGKLMVKVRINQNNKNEVSTLRVERKYSLNVEDSISFASLPPWTKDGNNSAGGDYVNPSYLDRITRVAVDSGTIASTNQYKPRSMYYFFHNMQNVTRLDNLNLIDTSDCRDMSYLFYNMKGYTGTFDVSSWVTSRCHRFHNMFYGSGASTILMDKMSNQAAWEVNQYDKQHGTNDGQTVYNGAKGSNGTMRGIFVGCSNLTTIKTGAGWRWFRDYTAINAGIEKSQPNFYPYPTNHYKSGGTGAQAGDWYFKPDGAGSYEWKGSPYKLDEKYGDSPMKAGTWSATGTFTRAAGDEEASESQVEAVADDAALTEAPAGSADQAPADQPDEATKPDDSADATAPDADGSESSEGSGAGQGSSGSGAGQGSGTAQQGGEAPPGADASPADAGAPTAAR